MGRGGDHRRSRGDLLITLATCILVAIGVSVIWDLLEPDAVTLHYNSPMRLLLSVAILVANLTLLLVLVL